MVVGYELQNKILKSIQVDQIDTSSLKIEDVKIRKVFKYGIEDERQAIYDVIGFGIKLEIMV